MIVYRRESFNQKRGEGVSDKLPTVVTPGLVRNLLKTNFKLRLPGDPLTGDLKARVVTLLPQVDYELTYREFQEVLPELLDLELRGALRITRYPALGPTDGVGVDYNTDFLAKASNLNFVGSLVAEDRSVAEGTGRVRVRLGWETYANPAALPADPEPLQTVYVQGRGFYYYDPTISKWLSQTIYMHSWKKIGTSTAKTVELEVPWEIPGSIYAVALQGSTAPRFDVLNASSRTVLLSTTGFTKTLLTSGLSLLAVRVSPSATAVTNPTLGLLYQEVLA